LRAEVPEVVVAHVVQGRADDPAAGQQPGLEEVEEAGQQLAPSQVAGGSEEHDHVRLDRGHRQAVDVVCVHLLAHERSHLSRELTSLTALRQGGAASIGTAPPAAQAAGRRSSPSAHHSAASSAVSG
jgi:hypothetical protein